MAVVKLVFLAAALAVTGCAGAQSDFEALIERVDKRDACIAAVQNELSVLQQRQPSTSDIRILVSDVFDSFSPSVRKIFAQAASASMDDIQAYGRANGDRRALIVRLREVTRQAFIAHFNPRIENCGAAAVEILPNFIYRYQHLDRPPLSEPLARIGLADSFSIEQAVLLMLVVEASGVEWQPEWFSEMASRD